MSRDLIAALASAAAWAEAPAVVAALKAMDVLELLSDHFAGIEDADDFSGVFGPPMAEIDEALHVRRDEAIAAALKEAGITDQAEHDEERDDVAEELEGAAPSAEGLYKRTRRETDWSLTMGAA